MIETVVVGYGLAGRAFHCPADPAPAGAAAARGRRPRPAVARGGRRDLGTSAAMPSSTRPWPTPTVGLVVIATPHDSHAELAVRALEAGKHCVVDKVMALTTAEADRMIAARDGSGRDALGLPQPALGLGLT